MKEKQCDRVTEAENVTVPSCSELVTMYNIKPPILKDILLLDKTESSDHFLEPESGFMAKVNTKVTPDETRRCPMCTFIAMTRGVYKNLFQECSTRIFKFIFCSYSNNKKVIVKRHEKRSHRGLLEEPTKLDGKSTDRSMEATVKKHSAPEESISDSEDWLKRIMETLWRGFNQKAAHLQTMKEMFMSSEPKK